MAVVETSDAGRVRTVLLNRPDRKNALSGELAWAVVSAVEEAARTDDVWVVVLTGAGDAFCSGLDLGGGGPSGSPLSAQDQEIDDLGWVGRFPLVLRYVCDKPVIAAVNGAAAGAGMSLAMACDIRLMAASARFIAGYPRMGGSPDGGLTWSLPQAIGYENAMRFLLENRTMNAEEALRLGLVGEVVPDDVFHDRVGEYAATVAARAPLASRLTKRGIVRATTPIDLESHVRYELSNISRAFRSRDAQEARQAFFEKRDPQFEGR